MDFISEIRRLDKEIDNVKGSNLVKTVMRMNDMGRDMVKTLIAIADFMEELDFTAKAALPAPNGYGQGYNDALRANAQDLRDIINQQTKGGE